MKILVLGKGAMGRAIGSLLEYNTVPFRYADRDLPIEETPDVVFLAVPTQQIRSALGTAKQFLSSATTIINCSKGIEQNTSLLPYEILDELVSPRRYFALIGPSFASEIVGQKHTTVSLGYRESHTLNVIRALIETPYFHMRETTAYEAIELSAAFKNVYAIAAGFASGIGCQMNTRALLIADALHEITHAIESRRYVCPSLAIPGIVGDLVLTCSSEESRNFSFGTHLAHLLPTQALEQSGHTVEGYHTSTSIEKWACTHGISLPLARLVRELVRKGKDGRKDFFAFIELLSGVHAVH